MNNICTKIHTTYVLLCNFFRATKMVSSDDVKRCETDRSPYSGGAVYV